MIPPAILSLRRQGDALEQRLIEWCEINSGSHHAAGLERMLARLSQDFAELREARLERVSTGPGQASALHLIMRPERPWRVLCSGHYDTVYGEKHPFQTCERLPDGRLRGPGVADMKGGLLVMLEALKAFEACPEAKRIGWEVLITPDEEIGSAGSEKLIRERAAGCQLGLVFEPARANGDLVRSRMGTGIFRIRCTGRAAHAAQIPNRGRNAIVALCRFLDEASRLPEQRPGTLLNTGTISGGGVPNVVPDLAEAVLNLRASRMEDARWLVSELERLAQPIRNAEGFGLEITGAFERMPKECGPTEETLFQSYQENAARLGLPVPGWQHAGGGSDGNLLSEAGLPNLDGLGIVGENLHSDQEVCQPASLVERAQLAALLLVQLASAKP